MFMYIYLIVTNIVQNTNMKIVFNFEYIVKSRSSKQPATGGRGESLAGEPCVAQ